MKFLRFGYPDQERPGVIDADGNIRDISAFVSDVNPRSLSDAALFNAIKKLDLSTLPKADANVRIGACVASPGKMICVGFNSRLHAQEMGIDPIVGKDMVVFLKPNSAICGPHDPILYTRHTKKLDWEAELGIVIGKKGKYIQPHEARDYIFGYTCVNDLSERYLQLETPDKQFTKGKGFDNAAPIGPYLVTQDEIIDSSTLDIKLWVNDSLRQDFNTRDYIHNEEKVICYLSQYFTLYPGDIISMGSAPGSAKQWGEDAYLKPHDKVDLCITGLGSQKQFVIIEEG